MFSGMGGTYPTASAGATLCAVRLSGKLNGDTIEMTPMGKLRTMADMPFVRLEMSIGAYSPAYTRPSHSH